MTPGDKVIVIVLSVLFSFLACLGGVIYLTAGDRDPVESTINVERFDLTLLSDAENARIVSGNFLFLIDKRVPVTVGGDIANETISRWNFYSAGNATIVRGTDLFVLNDPTAPGDEVEILIRHGASETMIVAEVGGN